jgi:rhodanese-related sulfurtransferase
MRASATAPAKRPRFASQLEARLAAERLAKSDPLTLIGRSVKRSAAAADLLAQRGFTRVHAVADGYEGDIDGDGPHKGQRAVNGSRYANLA